MKKLLSIVLILILCSLLFACGDEISVPGLDSQKTNDNKTNDSYTYRDDEYDYPYDNETTTTQQPTTALVEQETTVTTLPATTTASTTAASSMTKQQAQEIAEELVERHNYYDRNTTFCDVEEFWPFGDGEEDFNELVDNLGDLLTHEQQTYIDMMCYSILRCKCCNTYEQALAHANEYYVCDQIGAEGGYVEYNGNVYFIVYGEGAYGTLEEPVVKSFDDNCIVAQSYSGYSDAYATFTIEKIDGTFKITDIEYEY